LPLSMNPVLSTQMGTRHRAGIGITEETDAIAVIVSEESGAISMAVGGKIERDLTVEHLRELLSMELRRHMSPVGSPMVGPSVESDGALESPLRAGAQMSADEASTETERPL
jgi:hypothetical protein